MGGLIMLLFVALAKDTTQFSGVGWGIKHDQLSDNLLFHDCSSGVFVSFKKKMGGLLRIKNCVCKTRDTSEFHA
jgi:hypothetical protein